MNYKFYILEGAEAQKLLEDYNAAKTAFNNAREQWETTYMPLIATCDAHVVGVSKENRLQNPKKYGVCNECIFEEFYSYNFSKSSMKPNNKHYPMFTKYQEVTLLRPNFTDMVDKATNLNLSNLCFVVPHIYTGCAGISNNAPNIIFCKKPVDPDSNSEPTQYPPYVREVKESEWLARMGK